MEYCLRSLCLKISWYQLVRVSFPLICKLKPTLNFQGTFKVSPKVFLDVFRFGCDLLNWGHGIEGRWWYVLPDWPPADFDYAAALAERGSAGTGETWGHEDPVRTGSLGSLLANETDLGDMLSRVRSSSSTIHSGLSISIS